MPGSSQKPESDKQAEDERFNETLKRMLKTPHKRRGVDDKGKRKEKLDEKKAGRT